MSIWFHGTNIISTNQGATGLDMIPNRELWTNMPGLIKDGVSFTFNKITGRTSTASTYEKI